MFSGRGWFPVLEINVSCFIRILAVTTVDGLPLELSEVKIGKLGVVGSPGA